MSRQERKQAWEQPRWVVFAILALLVLVSTAASAQTTKTNETHEQPFSTDNFCNGDKVEGTAKQHLVASQTMKKDRIHFQMTDSRHGQGIGLPSGKKYSYGETTRMNVMLPVPPDGEPVGISRHRIRVISEGSSPQGDNFFMTFVTKVHRNGNSSDQFLKADCRGQGKESF